MWVAVGMSLRPRRRREQKLPFLALQFHWFLTLELKFWNPDEHFHDQYEPNFKPLRAAELRSVDKFYNTNSNRYSHTYTHPHSHSHCHPCSRRG